MVRHSLIFCVLLVSQVICSMQHTRDSKEKRMLEEKLHKIIVAAHEHPGKNNMCFHEVMQLVLQIQTIIDNPQEYKRQFAAEISTGEYTLHRSHSIFQQALRLFFEQPLIMHIGDCVDDSVIDVPKQNEKDLLENNRYLFRKNFISVLKGILFAGYE